MQNRLEGKVVVVAGRRNWTRAGKALRVWRRTGAPRRPKPSGAS